jgi:hypothetical protein
MGIMGPQTKSGLGRTLQWVKRMTVSDYFSDDYPAARAAFVEAAKAAGASLTRYRNPGLGPAGEDLSCDTAWIGPSDAEFVLVTLSATHGVEGFCGSGVQVGCFRSGVAGELPAGVAHLAIHAINPHGFAWLRRVTEENVDLNRNFADFSRPLPRNVRYEELAEVICPPTWDEATIARSGAELADYAERHGAKALQSAISGGQYSHSDGIFYGGRAPTWAHLTLKEIFASQLARAKRVAVVDYHTGLGPRGHGERICVHPPDGEGLARAEDWYSGDVTSPALGNSASVVLEGVNVIGMEEALPEGCELTAVALEYGTIPTEQVRLALRADNWLHLHGDLDSARGREIKAQIRAAFYQDADDWKEAIWQRGLDTQRLALAGLTQS